MRVTPAGGGRRHIPMFCRIAGATAANAQFLNPPAAYTTTTYVVAADFTGMTEYRLSSRTSAGTGPAGTKMAVEGTGDGGTTWTHLNGDATGSFAGGTPYVLMDTTGNYLTSWTTLAPALRGEVVLRVVTFGGDGASDPAIDNFRVECR